MAGELLKLLIVYSNSASVISSGNCTSSHSMLAWQCDQQSVQQERLWCQSYLFGGLELHAHIGARVGPAAHWVLLEGVGVLMACGALTLDDLQRGAVSRVALLLLLDVCAQAIADAACNGIAIDFGGRHEGRGAGEESGERTVMGGTAK